MKVLLLLVVVAIASIPAPSPEAVSPMLETVAIYTLPPLAECDYGCDETCGVGSYHETYTSSSQTLYSAGKEDCAPATHSDCDYHISCGPPLPNDESANTGPALADDTEFWTTLGEADGETLKAFLANNGHRATFNSKRRSIQVLGCTEKVRVNIPLSSDQAASLDMSD